MRIGKKHILSLLEIIAVIAVLFVPTVSGKASAAGLGDQWISSHGKWYLWSKDLNTWKYGWQTPSVAGVTHFWENRQFPYSYIDSQRGTLTGWQFLGSNWYYFDANGYDATGSYPNGTWQNINNNWYYFRGFGDLSGVYYNDDRSVNQPDGLLSMVTGWLLKNNVWYYLNQSGAMTTGWQFVNNNWYFLGNGGMQTGWQLINQSWYYLTDSGAMENGWVFINGNWYYLSGSGSMCVGWQFINDNWYYLYSNGSMATSGNVDGWTISQSGVAYR
ncbi:hypothetical protein [Furfurilactobacillus cerevisiae]|uniref:hypothetical protein n=1 Tax=Furfurilactobacillus rossiae TaxID=231049 RepID=UPI003B983B2B